MGDWWGKGHPSPKGGDGCLSLMVIGIAAVISAVVGLFHF